MTQAPVQPVTGDQQAVDNFMKRHASEFGDMAFVGGNEFGGFGIEAEREPWEFVTLYRVALMRSQDGTYRPANTPVRIKSTEVARTLAKRVLSGEPDAGSPLFAYQPVLAAGVTDEVALNSPTKSRKRRKRRRGSRGR